MLIKSDLVNNFYLEVSNKHNFELLSPLINLINTSFIKILNIPPTQTVYVRRENNSVLLKKLSLIRLELFSENAHGLFWRLGSVT